MALAATNPLGLLFRDKLKWGEHCYLIYSTFLGFSIAKIYGNIAKYKIFPEFWSRNIGWDFPKPYAGSMVKMFLPSSRAGEKS